MSKVIFFSTKTQLFKNDLFLDKMIFFQKQHFLIFRSSKKTPKWAQSIIVEPKNVVNTGDSTQSELTAENDVWI